MNFIKETMFFALCTFASAQHLAYGGQAAYSHAPAQLAYPRQVAYSAAPKVAKVVAPAAYQFGYSVNDALTGDSHSHTEAREGDVVKGQYQLVETDGSLRTVTYTADPINGFNAVVDRSPAAAPVIAKAPVYAHAAPHYAAHPVGRIGAPAYLG